MKTNGIVSFCIGAAMLIGGVSIASADGRRDHRTSRADRYGLFQDDRADGAERTEARRAPRANGRYGLFAGETRARRPDRANHRRPVPAANRYARTGAPADYVWIPGSYEWRSDRWVWVDGYWTRSRPGYRWEPARWVARNGGYARVGGYWVEDGNHVHIHHHYDS
jgi:hypothetical protein